MLPQPKEYRILKETFRPSPLLIIMCCPHLSASAHRYLSSSLESSYSKLLDFMDPDSETPYQIVLDFGPHRKKYRGGYYKIVSRPQGTVISAQDYPGLVHGVQSLRQIWHKAARQGKKDSAQLPCFDLEDWPSFSWRGLHLDTSRHYFDYKVIRRYLDWMAAVKLNKFHWHLSDDQGWRLESKRFPRLHEVGAWRKEEDGSLYGGFHTRKQVRLVLDYARDRGIEVVPEIDIPGHAMAILAAYPELACFPRDFEPLNVWGISTDILCAGKDSVIDFLKDLLDEVLELFPGQYIHLGGDEVPKERWKECPRCQRRIREEGLRDEEHLQAWFLHQLVAHVQIRGRDVIGWDEILDGGIDSRPIAMCWRGDGVDAARMAHDNGNRYIICPNNRLYFDWRYNEDPDCPGGFGVTTSRDVYGLDLGKFRFSNPGLFLGGQANLWTERISNSRRLKEMVYDRMLYMAELFWSDPPSRDFAECERRVKELKGLL